MSRSHAVQFPDHRYRRPVQGPALLLLAALLITVMSVWAPRAALAQTTNETLDLVSFTQTDLRALAMGNAFSPIARGETALLYNPAGVVQYDFDIKLDAAISAIGEKGSFFSDTLDQLNSSQTPQSVQAYLDKYVGTSQSYSGRTYYNLVANLAKFNFGIGGGALDRTRYQFIFDDVNGNNASDPTDTLQLDKDQLKLSVASAGFALFSGQLLLGATLKDFTFTRGTSGAVAFSTIAATGNIDLATTGDSYSASGYDLGFIWRVAMLDFLRMQWSAVGYNVGGITLTSPTTTTELDVPGTYNVGLAMNPGLPWSPVHLLISLEMEDVTGAVKVRDSLGTDHNRSPNQRMHFGMEAGFWETSQGNHILNVRVGNHRGQPTSGVEINLWSAFRILYTRYKEDVGWVDAPDVHTYQAAQISVGFGF